MNIVISVVLIVSLLVYIPLKLSGVLPIRNTYRPPLTFEEWKRRKTKPPMHENGGYYR